MKKYRIFISSTIEDMKDLRKKIADMLRAMRIFDPILVELLPASQENSRFVCIQKVKEADAIILLLKVRYGFVPTMDNPDNLSVTHLEYREAKRNNKPVFAFLYSGEKPEPALENFIQEVSDFDLGVLRKKWHSEEGLREEIKRALLLWVANCARQNGSEETQQQVVNELKRYPLVREIPIVFHPDSFQNQIGQNWQETLLNQLSIDCKSRLLPTPFFKDQLAQHDIYQPTLCLRIWPSSYSDKVNIEIEVMSSQQESKNSISMKFDAALTDVGAIFASQCCLALVLFASDNWNATIDQLLINERFRSASIISRNGLLATAAFVSTINQGQRSEEIIQRMLELHRIDTNAIGACILAIISAELRLTNLKAHHALIRIEKMALQLLIKALEQHPNLTENLYNFARQCLHFDLAISLTFYNELLRIDPTYDERWYFHRDLGLIYYDRKKYVDAAHHYDRASYLKDNDSELFRFAGDTYYYRGYWIDALTRYEKASSIEQCETHFLDFKISFCRFKIQNKSEREAKFRYKRNISFWFSNFGIRAEKMDLRWLAKPLFLISKRVCDLNFDANNWLALYANRRGAYIEAIEYLKSALSSVPEDPSVRLNLVMDIIFQNKGQLTDFAQKNAKTAIFHGGPKTIDRFRFLLINTKNKEDLCENFGKIFELVKHERDDWITRRREVLKPEMFGKVMHIEFRE